MPACQSFAAHSGPPRAAAAPRLCWTPAPEGPRPVPAPPADDDATPLPPLVPLPTSTPPTVPASALDRQNGLPLSGSNFCTVPLGQPASELFFSAGVVPHATATTASSNTLFDMARTPMKDLRSLPLVAGVVKPDHTDESDAIAHPAALAD